MKVRYLGVSRRVGKGKTSGNAYDICELSYAREIQPKRTENYVFTGSGFCEGTIPCDPQCMDKFGGVKLGQEVSLLVEPQPDNWQRNWVVGLA